MVVIYGDAGVGKTKGIEKFVQENPTSSVYIQATPSTGTLGNLLSVIARALKVPETRKRVDLVSAIQEKLERSNKVLIIDEAQHLQLRALDEIRAWTEPNPMLQRTGVGIALVGNTSVYTRMVGKQEADFGQLFSRIRMRRLCRTEEITREDIQKLFPKLTEGGKKKELDFLYGIGRSKWGIRGAVNVYNNAINNEDIQRGIGMGFNVARLDEKLIRQVLAHPWSEKHFSEAVWGACDHLAALAKREITLGFIQGSSVQKMAKAIDDVMDKGRYNANRLVRTECKYFANQGELMAYKENGVKQYRFIGGTEGSGSCTCAELNGQVFAIEDAVAGINYPPIHPNCLCILQPGGLPGAAGGCGGADR